MSHCTNIKFYKVLTKNWSILSKQIGGLYCTVITNY